MAQETVTVTLAGESITVAVPEASVPALPEVAIAALGYTPGTHVGAALKRLASAARVALEAATYTMVGNADTNGYGAYIPKALGLRGQGMDRTIVSVRPDSYTQLGTLNVKGAIWGTTGAGLLRMGPNNSSSQAARTLSDLSFIGTSQKDGAGKQLLRSGLWNYYGRGEVWQRLRLRNLSYAVGNSPNTGELFSANMYRDVDTRILDVEIDGRDLSGVTAAGGALNCAASTNIYIGRCSFHHSLYSGLSFSVAGTDVATMGRTSGVTVEDTICEQLANHPGVPGGSRFAVFANLEYVDGPIRFTRCTGIPDPSGIGNDSKHISHGGDRDNTTPMVVEAFDTRGAGPAYANGALVVSFWGAQKTAPVVKGADGSLLQPVLVTDVNNATGLKINPATQYALTLDKNYVAF